MGLSLACLPTKKLLELALKSGTAPTLPALQSQLQPPLDPTTRLPVTLPAANVPASALKAPKYGLETVAPHLVEPGTSLSQQLAELEAWSRAPLRLDRPTEFKPMLQERSWAVVDYSIKQYLGFLYTHHRPIVSLSLGLYSELFGPGFMRFLGFLKARKVHGGTFTQHCQVAERVLQWLRLGRGWWLRGLGQGLRALFAHHLLGKKRVEHRHWAKV